MNESYKYVYYSMYKYDIQNYLYFILHCIIVMYFHQVYQNQIKYNYESFLVITFTIIIIIIVIMFCVGLAIGHSSHVCCSLINWICYKPQTTILTFYNFYLYNFYVVLTTLSYYKHFSYLYFSLYLFICNTKDFILGRKKYKSQ